MGVLVVCVFVRICEGGGGVSGMRWGGGVCEGVVFVGWWC